MRWATRGPWVLSLGVAIAAVVAVAADALVPLSNGV